MSSTMPPIPPANRSPHQGQQVSSQDAMPNEPGNPDKQGQAGNSKINTTHQGYQQDR